MPRTALSRAGVLLLPAVALAALSGCSSGSGHSDGRLDYTGSVSGGFDLTSGVGCVLVDGKPAEVLAPVKYRMNAPSSFAAIQGKSEVINLGTPDGEAFGSNAGAGVTFTKKDGTWTVNVSGTKLTTRGGGSVTVNGHLTCTKLLH